MGDGAAKRAALGFVSVGMYPLVVTRSLGKQIDLFLRDCDPIADRHVLSHAGLQFFEC